jgi:uncharacterized DUF497 family protein
MNLAGTAFDWDAGNTLKCQKHGVLKGQIEALFLNDPLVAPDVHHSDEEDRLIAMGLTDDGRRIFVVFTLRARDDQPMIRPISARYMRDKEYLRYAKTGAQDDDG